MPMSEVVKPQFKGLQQQIELQDATGAYQLVDNISINIAAIKRFVSVGPELDRAITEVLRQAANLSDVIRTGKSAAYHDGSFGTARATALDAVADLGKILETAELKEQFRALGLD